MSTPLTVNGLTIDELLAFHRATFGDARMMADGEPGGDGEPGESGRPEQTFTQADVDRIVADRLKRERETTKAKYGDYDDLKARAGEAKSLEERVAAIEQQAKDAESRAMRAEIANAKGLTPSQAKRLVGSTREELEADADELLADIGVQKKQGNHVPNEGQTPTSPQEDPEREFARRLFSGGD